MWNWIDRLLPPSFAHGEPARRNVGRLLIVFTLALAINGPIYVGIFYWLGAPALAANVAVATAVVGTVPVTFRYTESLAISVNQALLGLWGVITAVALETGGISSPPGYWFTLMPAFGMLLVGTRMALAWTAVSIATLLGMGAAELAGVPFPNTMPPTAMKWYWLTNPLTIIPLHLGIVALFQAARARMLEEIEEARAQLAQEHARAVTILDTVEDGLVLLNRDGQVLSQPSRAAVSAFGSISQGETIWRWLERRDPRGATMAQLGWEGLTDGIMPLEISLEQLQVKLSHGGREYATQARLVDLRGEHWTSALLLIRDVTAARAAERARAESEETRAVLEHIGRDREGLITFFDELQAHIKVALDPETTAAEAFRAVHTIKGCCGLFGVCTLTSHCHHLEDALREDNRELTEDERQALRATHQAVLTRLAPILRTSALHEVSDDALHDLAHLIERNAPRERLLSAVKRMRWTPVEIRLHRLGEQGRALGARLGKGDIQIEVDAAHLFEAPHALDQFWSVLSHLVRNAVDHGFGPALQESGARRPILGLHAELNGQSLVLSVTDNGKGIDWNRVAEKARAAGLPASTAADLTEGLFTDQISTATEITEVSGRGVGMAAVRDAVRALGGTIDVQSELGAGTTVLLRVPCTGRVELLPGGDALSVRGYRPSGAPPIAPSNDNAPVLSGVA